LGIRILRVFGLLCGVVCYMIYLAVLISIELRLMNDRRTIDTGALRLALRILRMALRHCNLVGLGIPCYICVVYVYTG